jgi:beta-galactosidase
MLKIADNKLVIGKEEYHPFSAEMHYFRVNKRYWSICFERIRKAGFRIISTRVPWNLHEPAIGDFDFMGATDHSKDLVVFLELAREFGLKVILYPGPFIGSDWKGGGYPDFLHKSPEILARSPAGEPLQVSGKKDGEVKTYLFSELHPRFLTHVKRYFAALSDVIKSYVYPKGPVIMVRLDNGLSAYLSGAEVHDLDPFGADYNQYLTGTLFPDFLKQKYEDPRKLGQLYGEKHRHFTDVAPPTELKISKLHNLIRYFDWMDFREKANRDFILRLKELYLSFEVAPLFCTGLFTSRDFSVPFNWQSTESDDLLTGIDLTWCTDHVELARHLRYYGTCCRFAWASEFAVGAPADSPRDAARYFPVPPRKVKSLLTSALAAGLRGFNYYMFVERDHWYDAPLANDGTIRPSFDLTRKFTEMSARIQLNSLKWEPQLGLAVYRPYLWYDLLYSRSSEKTPDFFPYLKPLLSKTHKGLSRDLMSLRLDYGMPDLWLEESLQGFPVLLVPCAEFMDEKTQQLLVNLVKEGTTLILFGLLPRLDLRMRPCKVLADALRLQTKAQSQVGNVKALDQEFTAPVYGYIRGAKRSGVLAKSQDRTLGAVTKLGQGRVFLFTFDISAQLYHPKLSFLENVLSQSGAESQVYCDDPEVELSFQSTETHNVLLLVDTRQPCPSSPDDGSRRQTVLRFDPRKLGIRGSRLRMTDLLGDEVTKTSSQALRNGILLSLEPQASRMYLIEAK